MERRTTTAVRCPAVGPEPLDRSPTSPVPAGPLPGRLGRRTARLGIRTIGRVNCVLHDQKTVVDNHVTILRVRPGSINPLFLAVFLNSELGREQTYRWQSGSSGQLEIYPTDVKRFLVPVPDNEVQTRIAEQLKTAYHYIILAEDKAATAAAEAVSIVRQY